MKYFPFRLAGVASSLGAVVPIDEWAERISIPHRHRPGERLSGAEITKILGLRSKSWDPDLFGNFDVVRHTAMQALKSAGVPPAKVDLAMVITCTPYEVMLDQDSFRLFRGLGLPDDVVPIQLGAGCAGLARAASLASRTNAERVLVVAYNVPSLFLMVNDSQPSPAYLSNPNHPLADTLWASPAIFSDGAAAIVFERTNDPGGRCFYSRDSQSFGRGPGFDSTLVTFRGGGALNPPGSAACQDLSCFAMEGDKVKDYYMNGMMENHRLLKSERPRYDSEMKRIYVHQSSPALVNGFVDMAGLDPSKVAAKVTTYGNLVTPSTMRLIHEDVVNGALKGGDEICLSVVGAGPERGALMCKVDTREVIPL